MKTILAISIMSIVAPSPRATTKDPPPFREWTSAPKPLLLPSRWAASRVTALPTKARPTAPQSPTRAVDQIVPAAPSPERASRRHYRPLQQGCLVMPKFLLAAIFVGIISQAMPIAAHEFWIDPQSDSHANVRVGQMLVGENLPYLDRIIRSARHFGPDGETVLKGRQGDIP